MRRLKLTGAALLGCVLIGLASAPAMAATKTNPAASGVLADCATNGRLTQVYSVAELRKALKSIPPTQAEYGNCGQVIQAQLARQRNGHLAGGHDVGSGSGSNSNLLVIVIVVVVVVIVALAGYLFTRRRAGSGESADPPPPTA